MAVELAQFLAEQLQRVPENHPDARFLRGLHEAVTAYTGRLPGDATSTAAAVAPVPVEAAAAVPEKPEIAPVPAPVEEEAAPRAESRFPRRSERRSRTSAEVTQPDAAAAKEQQRRVSLAGLVAAVPDFRTSPRGVRIGHFPLATHPTTETTTYYEVYAFNKDGKLWADRLRELALTRGQAVEVIGFEHVITETRRDGRPKPNHIYVAAPVRRKPAPEKAG